MSERNLEPPPNNVSEELKMALEYLFGIAQSRNLNLTSHLIDAAKKSLDLNGANGTLSRPDPRNNHMTYEEGQNDD